MKTPVRLMAFLAQRLMAALPQLRGWLVFKIAEFSGLFFLHSCAGGIELGICVGVGTFQTPTLSRLLTHSYCADSCFQDTLCVTVFLVPFISFQ